MGTVAIVTGGSSGIGRETARCLMEQNITVYEFSRRDTKALGITHFSVDVTDEPSVQAAVQAVLEREKHIDILVTVLCQGKNRRSQKQWRKTERKEEGNSASSQDYI